MTARFADLSKADQDAIMAEVTARTTWEWDTHAGPIVTKTMSLADMRAYVARLTPIAHVAGNSTGWAAETYGTGDDAVTFHVFTVYGPCRTVAGKSAFRAL